MSRLCILELALKDAPMALNEAVRSSTLPGTVYGNGRKVNEYLCHTN